MAGNGTKSASVPISPTSCGDLAGDEVALEHEPGGFGDQLGRRLGEGDGWPLETADDPVLLPELGHGLGAVLTSSESQEASPLASWS